MPRRTLAGLVLAVAMLTGGVSPAVADLVYPVIPQFGKIAVMPSAAERPDPKLRYRVLFSVKKAALSPDKLNPSLEKVARFVNLLGADKVRPALGDVVAIVQCSFGCLPRSPITAN